MVNPDIGTSLFNCHVVPVITVICAFSFIIPLPDFIKFDVSDNDVA